MDHFSGEKWMTSLGQKNRERRLLEWNHEDPENKSESRGAGSCKEYRMSGDNRGNNGGEESGMKENESDKKRSSLAEGFTFRRKA